MTTQTVEHALKESEWYATGEMGLRNITPFTTRFFNALQERHQFNERQRSQQTTLASVAASER